MTNPSITFVGDTHGQLDDIGAALEAAADHGSDRVVQVGDFGIGLTSTPVGKWLATLDRLCANYEIDQFVFIAGNHENWDLLDTYRQTGNVDEHGFHRVTDRIRWADNATTWTWHGIRFGALGGAHSIDHRYRVEGVSVWSALEKPTNSQMRTIATSKLDVLVTHDAPETVGKALGAHSGTIPIVDEAISQTVREQVRTAVAGSEASHLIHGHWHRRYTQECLIDGRKVTVDGLADGSWGVAASVAHLNITVAGWNIGPVADPLVPYGPISD